MAKYKLMQQPLKSHYRVCKVTSHLYKRTQLRIEIQQKNTKKSHKYDYENRDHTVKLMYIFHKR